MERPLAVGPTDSRVAHDAEAERRYQLEQSKALVGLLKARTSLAERFIGMNGTEATANQVDMYAMAWSDVAIRTAADLAEDITNEIETSLCDLETTDPERVVMVRLVARSPEFATARGLECVIQGRKTEDIVLWEALKAWNVSKDRMLGSSAIEALAHRAVDGRTTALLDDIRGVQRESLPAIESGREQ